MFDTDQLSTALFELTAALEGGGNEESIEKIVVALTPNLVRAGDEAGGDGGDRVLDALKDAAHHLHLSAEWDAISANTLTGGSHWRSYSPETMVTLRNYLTERKDAEEDLAKVAVRAIAMKERES